MRFLSSMTILVATATMAAADPAEPVALGQEIYARICLECHGPTASEGEVGDIRGLSLGSIMGAVRSGPGMMPTIALTDDEITWVAAYLASLQHGDTAAP